MCPWLKALIVFYATVSGVSFASFAIVIDARVEIASTTFSFTFSITTELIKKLLKATQNKVVMLARSRLNTVEMHMVETALVQCQ